MDWKEFTEQPDEGLFENIQHRLHVRRMWRIGGGVTAVVAVLAVAAVALLSKPDTQVEDSQVATAEVAMTEVSRISGETAVESAETMPTVVPVMDNSSEVAVAGKQMQQTEEAAVAVRPQQPMTQMPNMGVSAYVAEIESRTAVRNQPQPLALPVLDIDSVIEAYLPKVGEPSDTVQNNKKTAFSILKAPNAIVPSDEENRYFGVTPTEAISDFTIRIFNRRGQQVYQSRDLKFQWDGVYNGSTLPQGGYVWVATFRTSDGKPHNERGTVAIIR